MDKTKIANTGQTKSYLFAYKLLQVDTLMDLAREKFKKLLEEKDKIMEKSVCIRVIGNLSLLPVDLRKLIAEAVILTKENNKAILNIAFSYTSRDEIVHSINTVLKAIKNQEIELEDIDENLISNCLYTHASPNPDILIRTSGEVRLSDFLLWQTSYTQICFTDVLWPEFSIWDLMKLIFKYQSSYDNLQKYKADNIKCKTDGKTEAFMKKLAEKELAQFKMYAGLKC